jgi:hypothetical protein
LHKSREEYRDELRDCRLLKKRARRCAEWSKNIDRISRSSFSKNEKNIQEINIITCEGWV